MNSDPDRKDPKSAPRRNRRPPAEIMERLIVAAGQEFEACGYTGATTAAIARRANVTEAQLFRYFSSKADLFQETVFKPLNEHLNRFGDASPVSDVDDNANLARTYIGELQSFLGQHSRMIMALLVARAYSPSSQIKDDMDSLASYFERGAIMMGRSFADRAEVDPRLTVRISFAAVLACALLDDWLFPPGLADRTAIDEAISVFVINGITPAEDNEGPMPGSG